MTERKRLLKKHKFKISFLVILMVIVVGFIQPLRMTYYDIDDDFNLKILHISDFHDYQFKEEQVMKLLKEKPDIVVFTGDMIDRNRYDLDNMMNFVELFKDYPMYYVTGNHEAASGHLDEVINALEALNVNVLQNEVAMYKDIQIVGLNDLLLGEKYPQVESGPKVLLVHRASRVEALSHKDVDLILAGHAHGGQWRLFNQGVLSPDQGFFPKYTSGLHELNGSNAVISRGMGNSIMPLRWYNGPEMVFINITNEN